MSNPERLVFSRSGLEEEICVTPHTDDMDQMRAVGVPNERDIALVLSNVTDEWFERFLRALQRRSPNRAMVIASIVETAAINDVAGGDVDPGFAFDPKDSAELLRIRQAIDSYLGWKNQADEARGDYVTRVREVGDALVPTDTRVPGEQLVSCLELNNSLSSEVTSLRTQVQMLTEHTRRQRKELRRLNAAERARKKSNVPLHVTHDRWLQKLHALEQRTALGTANQADIMTIERLRRWLGDYP